VRITRRKFFAAVAGFFGGGFSALAARAERPVFYSMTMDATRMCDGVVKIESGRVTATEVLAAQKMVDPPLVYGRSPLDDYFEAQKRCNNIILDSFRLTDRQLGVPRGTHKIEVFK